MTCRPRVSSLLVGSLLLLVLVALGGCDHFGPGPTPTPRGNDGEIVATPTPTPAPAPEDDGVALVEWIVYRQRGIAFFEVHRSTSADGPFELLTGEDQVILGEGDSDEEVRYSYLDRGLRVGRPYHYRIAQVDVTGRRTWFSRRPMTKVAIARAAFEAAAIEAPPAAAEPAGPATVDRTD